MTQAPLPERTDEASGPPAGAIGAVRVIVWLLLFIGQYFDVGIGAWGWPFIVIGIGAVVLGLGLFVMNEQGMVIGGTVAMMVGLVLLYQDRTGHWESWAYAWALVGPAASGLGLALWGLRSSNAGDVHNGIWGLLGGLAFFAVGFLCFEGLIGISGERLPLAEGVLPAAVIVIGVVVLMRGLLQRGHAEQP